MNPVDLAISIRVPSTDAHSASCSGDAKRPSRSFPAVDRLGPLLVGED